MDQQGVSPKFVKRRQVVLTSIENCSSSPSLYHLSPDCVQRRSLQFCFDKLTNCGNAEQCSVYELLFELVSVTGEMERAERLLFLSLICRQTQKQSELQPFLSLFL